MKKMIILLFLCVVTVVITKKIHQDKVDPLLLNNIEAIASEESGVPTKCYGSGDLDCPVSHDKVKHIYGGYSLEIR